MCLNSLVRVAEGMSYLCRYRNGTIIKKDFSDDVFWDYIKTVEIVKMKFNKDDSIMEVWLDIDDIHDKFGDKYDDAIAEMMEYVDQLEQEGKI